MNPALQPLRFIPAALACMVAVLAQEPVPTAVTASATPAVALLRLSGAYADLPEAGFDPTSLLLGGVAQPKGFFPLLDDLDSVAKGKANELLVDLSGNPSFNIPQLRELERAFLRVRGAGKKVVCYLENGTTAVVQLAAMADEVLMADMGVLDLRSPAMSVMHLKDALDLLGVQVEVTRVGEYKGAVEPYILPQMSDHLRKHYEAMLGTINADVVRRLASGRKLEEAKLRALQGQRLIPAMQAKAEGLVDRLVPWAGAKRAYALVYAQPDAEFLPVGKKKPQQGNDLLSVFSSMLRGSREREVEEPQVVVMHLSGQIVDGDNPAPGSMVSGPVVKKLDQLASNEFVKGVVVRINSPGGSATASEAIRLGLQRLAAKKPLVFTMGNVAASGGYWITTLGRPILAEASTITGSIGVFGMRMQTGALMRRIGVHTDVVALDEGPLMDATDRPMSEAARARMQAFVDDIYERFLGNVAASRKMTREAVDRIAGGRVWSGAQALDLGLVDGIGGVFDAIDLVLKEANLKLDDVDIVHQPEPKTLADSLLASLTETQIAAGVSPALLGSLLGRCHEAGMLQFLVEAMQADGSHRCYAMLPRGLTVH